MSIRGRPAIVAYPAGQQLGSSARIANHVPALARISAAIWSVGTLEESNPHSGQRRSSTHVQFLVSGRWPCPELTGSNHQYRGCPAWYFNISTMSRGEFNFGRSSRQTRATRVGASACGGGAANETLAWGVEQVNQLPKGRGADLPADDVRHETLCRCESGYAVSAAPRDTRT